ncbi:MAG: efflux RND transporter periplasmic adaptor subunit [Bacteroidales bacterium]|nr:efflux RND transporter periplasmic adaptor subunit [Bacteroidales bacterium]
MKTIKLINLLVAAGLIAFATSCNSGKENEAQIKGTKQAVPVKTMIAKNETITKTIDYTASLIPFKEIYLAPAAPGKIEKIHVEIGDRVSKGQVIATMDRTNLESARLNLANLETNFKRLEILKKTNTISQQKYDEVKTAYDAAKVSYQFLLDNTKLKAPFNGVISGKYFEDGENFSGAPNTRAGKSALVTIVQINKLKALIGISASYFPQIKKGMKANISCDIYPDKAFEGEIYNIYPTIDDATKTFTVEVKINNPDLKLRPGMFTKIQLNLGEGKAILVPTIALIKQTGTNNMYLFVNKNNIAVKQPVVTGRLFDDKTEILKGINKGNEIIITGQNKLKNNAAIVVEK